MISKEQQMENLRKVWDFADLEAEKMDRPTCLRVQQVIEEIRQKEIERLSNERSNAGSGA